MPIPALSPSRLVSVIAVLLLALVGAGAVVGGTHAALTGDSQSPGNRISAAPDWTPPTVSRSAVTTFYGATEAVVEGQEYYVYAQVTDGGRPPSGVAGVNVDASAVTTGATSAPMANGNWTVAGMTYNHRSEPLTARAGIGTGTHAYRVRATDGAGYVSGFDASMSTAENTAPVVLGSRAASSGGSAGVGTFTVQRPAYQPGGLLMFVMARTDDVLFTPPAGWTARTLVVDGGQRLRVWTKLATASEPASYTWTATTAGQTTRIAAAIVGFSPSSVFSDSYGVEESATPVATHSTPPLTVSAQSRVISIFSTRAAGQNLGWASAQGSEFADTATSYGSGPNVSLGMYEIGARPAGTYTGSATSSVASTDATMTLLAFR